MTSCFPRQSSEESSNLSKETKPKKQSKKELSEESSNMSKETKPKKQSKKDRLKMLEDELDEAHKACEQLVKEKDAEINKLKEENNMALKKLKENEELNKLNRKRDEELNKLQREHDEELTKVKKEKDEELKRSKEKAETEMKDSLKTKEHWHQEWLKHDNDAAYDAVTKVQRQARDLEKEVKTKSQQKQDLDNMLEISRSELTRLKQEKETTQEELQLFRRALKADANAEQSKTAAPPPIDTMLCYNCKMKMTQDGMCTWATPRMLTELGTSREGTLPVEIASPNGYWRWVMSRRPDDRASWIKLVQSGPGMVRSAPVLLPPGLGEWKLTVWVMRKPGTQEIILGSGISRDDQYNQDILRGRDGGPSTQHRYDPEKLVRVTAKLLHPATEAPLSDEMMSFVGLDMGFIGVMGLINFNPDVPPTVDLIFA